MSQYYNRLSELNGNYTIRTENRERRFKYIGQLIIKHVVTFEKFENSFRNFIEVNSFREWSPYFLKFYEDIRQNQNDTTVFITFSSTTDHLDFVRIFDEMRFGQFNGLTKRLSVRVNGFTNETRYNGDLGNIRFTREMIDAVKDFNNDLMRPRIQLNQQRNNNIQLNNDDGFTLVRQMHPISNAYQREMDTQRRIELIRQRARNDNNNNDNNNNSNNNNSNNNKNNEASRRRQREPFPSSESTESLNEPPARRQNLLSLVDMKLEAPTSIEFVRWTPPLQAIKTIEVEPRENFEFYL